LGYLRDFRSSDQSLATSTSTAIVSNREAYRVVQAVLKIGFYAAATEPS
jgi:hypothetical protein